MKKASITIFFILLAIIIPSVVLPIVEVRAITLSCNKEVQATSTTSTPIGIAPVQRQEVVERPVNFTFKKNYDFSHSPFQPYDKINASFIVRGISNFTEAGVSMLLNTTILSGTSRTAEEMARMYQPYLFLDTGRVIPFPDKITKPEAVYYRIFMGFDQNLSKTAIAIMYYFYWNESYVDYVKIHDYNYEQVLIFVDPSNIGKPPYRVVFDSGDYTDISTLGHKPSVYEQTPRAMGYRTFNTTIFGPLTPLLGNLTKQTIYFDNLTKEARWHDFTHIKIFVKTAYHTFGWGGEQLWFRKELGFDYNDDLTNDLLPLTDTVLRIWYSRFDEFITAGFNWVSVFGVNLPNKAPFTHDVSNPFKFPYFVSSYSYVVGKAEEYIDQIKNNFLDIKEDFNLNVTILIPALIRITHPSPVLPGSTFNSTIEILLLTNNVTFSLDYLVNVTLNINAYLLRTQRQFLENGTLIFYLPLRTWNATLNALNIPELTKNLANIVMGKYITVDFLNINPSVVGTLLNASLSIHIWQILKEVIRLASELDPEPGTRTVLTGIHLILEAISLVALKSIDLVLNPLLQALMVANVGIENNLGSINVNTIQLTGEQVVTPVTVTVSKFVNEGDVINLVLSNVNYNFNFKIGWSVFFAFAGLVKILYKPSHTIELGYFPNVTGGMQSLAVKIPIPIKGDKMLQTATDKQIAYSPNRLVSISSSFLDPGGIDEATLSYSTDLNMWTNASMTRTSDIYHVEINKPSTNMLYMKFYVKDGDGDWYIDNAGSHYSLEIDNTPPQIRNVTITPSSPKPDEKVTVAANIQDYLTGVYNASILYSTDDGVSWKSIQMSANPQNNATYKAEIAPFQSEIKVSCKVLSFDKAGNSAESSIIKFLVNKPPTAVTLNTPTSADITESSITLTWTENTDADFARYEIYQSTSSGNLGTLIATITDKATTTRTITGLSADTTYYFTIRVVDTGGLTADSIQISVKTSSAPPPTPTPTSSSTPLGIETPTLLMIGFVVGILAIGVASYLKWIRKPRTPS